MDRNSHSEALLTYLHSIKATASANLRPCIERKGRVVKLTMGPTSVPPGMHGFMHFLGFTRGFSSLPKARQFESRYWKELVHMGYTVNG